MILTPLQKLPKNVEDLGKLIVAKGLKKLPKVQKIAQSGHTAPILSPTDGTREYIGQMSQPTDALSNQSKESVSKKSNIKFVLFQFFSWEQMMA